MTLMTARTPCQAARMLYASSFHSAVASSRTRLRQSDRATTATGRSQALASTNLSHLSVTEPVRPTCGSCIPVGRFSISRRERSMDLARPLQRVAQLGGGEIRCPADVEDHLLAA